MKGLSTKQALEDFLLFVPNFDDRKGMVMANDRLVTSYGLKDKVHHVIIYSNDI